ncbi:hypothetical protein [Jannaschia seohaensis]|uniref:Uncharacterized protein n=1 Tax=Jannaschia seohaensis TaxID=475081 RepID=A0A2Y9ABM5_9RHOB|nr:hypothetical protein [Jannaschia seohaensis]PWJ21175.1 hypothetical protein BCF38_102425 [Jannaschia seohaensis]SSA41585.1 hypothetical protein SAMN05421539_102425 [Jannaschia seohaensis]
MIRAARRLGVCLLLGGSLWAGPALAQFAGPAETPPETFRGDQFVDSTGCVFIRTGIDGNTRWVPRVNRDRTPVCGARPSAATPPVRATAPVIRRTPAPAAPREIEAARPAPMAPASQPLRTAAPAPMRAAPMTRPAAMAQPAPQAAMPMQAANLPPGCGASALSARYIPGCTEALTSASTPALTAAAVTVAPAETQRYFTASRPLRANEQVVTRFTPPAGAVRIDAETPSPNRAVGVAGIAAPAPRDCVGDCGRPGGEIVTRLPAEIAERPQVVVVPAARTTFDVSTPPRGYRTAWDDGRLNPHRGPRTLQGDYQSQAIWTNDSPRRLKGVIYTSR